MVSIAIFLTDLKGGGAERVMLHLAHGFVKQGLDVELVLVNMEGSYMSQSPQEVKVMHLGDKKLLQSLSALIK